MSDDLDLTMSNDALEDDCLCDDGFAYDLENSTVNPACPLHGGEAAHQE